MHNIEVLEIIDSCQKELEEIKIYIQKDPLFPMVRFLIIYSLIKAYGSIEFAFKTILSDYLSTGQPVQTKNYFTEFIRMRPFDIRHSRVCDFLKKCDNKWLSDFKIAIDSLGGKDKILNSLQSLHDSRNAFAHGGGVSVTFESVEEYFTDAVEVIKILDNIIR